MTNSATSTAIGGQIGVATDGVFYAYIHNIADDNTWRFTLVFANRDTADQWWRAVSTSTVAFLQNNIQRITPQFYTHNPGQWNIIYFFTDARIQTLSAQFRGKFFMALENDRGGRGITIIPSLNIVDHISGNWFSIRSKDDPRLHWYYDRDSDMRQKTVHVVVSSTQRALFQIVAPDLKAGDVMIGSDDMIIIAQNQGVVNPGPKSSDATNGGCPLQVGAPDMCVPFRFKFGDLKSGVFVPTSVADGSRVLYDTLGGAGSSWELSQ